MLRIETMDRDRTRQLAREFAARKVGTHINVSLAPVAA